MHGFQDADYSNDQQLALIHHCPKCAVPRVMSLEAIRPAMFGNKAIIGYRCETCATRRVDVVSSHAVGQGGGLFYRRLTARHNRSAVL
jgi:C4-type Zn-finger protein